MTPARPLLLCLWIAAASFAQAPKQSIEIWSVDPIAIDIEWLTIDDKGHAEITAHRATVIGPPVPLEFTHGADRYVRFSYQGASPRTYSTAELIAAKRLHVPDVLPGGELFILVPQAPVRPARLRLEGPRSPVIDLTPARHVSLSGMPEGEYRIVLLYDGGVPGAVENANVRTARTVIAPLPIEEVGGVRVAASYDACGSATEMGIDQLVVAKVGPEIKAPPNRMRWAVSKEPQCEMRFGGLKPGEFEVFYRSGTAPAGSAYFTIEPQAWTTAEVAGAAIRLEGRVTVNGKPAPETRVVVTPRSTSSRVTPRQAEATADAAGNYTVALEAPGQYIVRAVRPRTMFTDRREITIVEGRNVYDVVITGGTIVVDIKGWDQQARLQVDIQGANAGGASMISMFSGRQPLPAFEGLPFGEYIVSVRTADTRQTRQAPRLSQRDLQRGAQRVVLSASSPVARLTFDVTKR